MQEEEEEEDTTFALTSELTDDIFEIWPPQSNKGEKGRGGAR